MRPKNGFDWGTFAREHWHKKPGVFKQPFDVPLGTMEEGWSWLLEVTRLKGSIRPMLPKVWIYTEEGAVSMDVQKYMPVAADKNLEGFEHRITDMLGGRRFAFVLNDFQVIDHTLWARLRDIARGLYAHTGDVVDKIDIALFFGNTKKTGFGVHADTSDGMAFIIKGDKMMRTWAPDHVNAQGVKITSLRNTSEYAAHTEGSILLEGEPGDLLYWPQSHWHCAENPTAALSFSLHIGIEVTRKPYALGALVSKHADRMRQERGAAKTYGFPRFDGSDANAPLAKLAEAIADQKAIAAEVLDSVELRDDVTQDWLRIRSAYGILDGPPPSTQTFDLQDDVKLAIADGYPVLYAHGEAEEGKLIVAANGETFDMGGGEVLAGLIDHMNKGAPFTVKELVALAEEAGVPGDDAKEILSTFLSVYALHVVS